MKKSTVILLCAVMVLGVVALALSTEQKPPEGKIKITLPEAAKKPPVIFDHNAHITRAGDNCAACHHQTGEKQFAKCTSCHTAKHKKLGVRGRRVFHKLCSDCHATKKKGPTYPADCTTCHKK